MVVTRHTEAQALVRKYLDRLSTQVRNAAHTAGADEIHDLRVTIRRLVQVLRIFRPYFPGKEVKRVQRSLKKHIAPAGAVRDFDIIDHLLAQSKLPEARSVRARMLARRKNAADDLRDELRRWTRHHAYSKWRRKLIASPGDLGENQVLPDLLQDFRTLGNRAASLPPDIEKLHKVRIAGKKLRYSLEVFAPSSKRISQLRNLQDILGNLHDADVAREILSSEHGASRLAAEMARKRDDHVQEFQSLWKSEFSHWVLRKPPTSSQHHKSSPAQDVQKVSRVAH